MPVTGIHAASSITDIEDVTAQGDDLGTGNPYRVSLWEVNRKATRGMGVRRRKAKTAKGDDDSDGVVGGASVVETAVAAEDGAGEARGSKEEAGAVAGTAPDFVLPGSQSVYVRTWGCSHNSSDAEYMSGLLAQHGHPLVLSDTAADTADVWLLNSCTVKGPSEASFLTDVRKAQQLGKKVVVAGCVPQASSRDKRWEGISIIGVQQIDRVVEVVEETIRGNCVQLLRDKKPDPVPTPKSATTPSVAPPTTTTDAPPAPVPKPRKAGGAALDLPKVRRNTLVEIVPINTGCLNQCTYCKTKFSRGDLGSYPPSAILARIEHVLQYEGVTEVWITSEDVGAWGRDLGLALPDLLSPLAALLPRFPHAMLRLGMTNPPHIRAHLASLIEFLNHPQVYAFLHVPVQSGSDKVLRDMRRDYDAQGFWEVAIGVRKGVEGATIATDVICGFPTETSADHAATLSLLDRLRPPVLHISQFYPRPGTPAARLTPCFPDRVKKERSREITRLFDSYHPYEGMEGSTVRCLVTDVASDGVKLVGHDKSYRQVVLEDVTLDDSVVDDEGKAVKTVMGRWCRVAIFRTGKFFIEGRVVGVEPGPQTVGRVEVEIDGDDGPGAGTVVGRGVVRRLGRGKKPPVVKDGPTYAAMELEDLNDPEDVESSGREEDDRDDEGEEDRLLMPEDPTPPPPEETPPPQRDWSDTIISTILVLACWILLSLAIQMNHRSFTERMMMAIAGSMAGVAAADWLGVWDSDVEEEEGRQWS